MHGLTKQFIAGLIAMVVTAVTVSLLVPLIYPQTAEAVEQTPDKRDAHNVFLGVGAPASADPVTVLPAGTVDLSDGTNPILIPWDAVVNVRCPELVGTTDVVLACFTLNIASTVDYSDGQISDGTRDSNLNHCRWVTPDASSVDMRLDRRRLLAGNTPRAGFRGAVTTIGVCEAEATDSGAFHLAACVDGSEATDCGDASAVCDDNGAIAWKRIAGAWMSFDTSNATDTLCYVDYDI